MNKEKIVKKNLDLLDEFMKYAFDHPDILDEIPRDANLVLLPERDSSLKKANKKILSKLKAKGEETVAIRIRTSKRKVSKVG
jgi:predicted ATP-grasp superfamily ATP-dependent carboligase